MCPPTFYKEVPVRLSSKKSCYHVDVFVRLFAELDQEEGGQACSQNWLCWWWWVGVWKEGTCILTSADTLAIAMPKRVGRAVDHRGPHTARVCW